MNEHLDLSDFHVMTGNDTALEKALFDEYISSSETAIAQMSEGCNAENSELYRSNAHALKGTSLNLGAHKLAELCKNAQEQHMAPLSEKEDILLAIKAEYSAVKDALLRL